MFNAYGLNFKCNVLKCQQVFSLSFCYLVREGKGFFDRFKLTSRGKSDETVSKAFSFHIQPVVKFVLIVLIFSLLINFVLINGRAFFMQAAAFPEPLATYPAFSAISSMVSGI